MTGAAKTAIVFIVACLAGRWITGGLQGQRADAKAWLDQQDAEWARIAQEIDR
jgi:hypothetical protein